MTIIEIAALENGSHRNQSGRFKTIPEGWAEIPADMEIPATFPFVNITVINGVVSEMTAGTMPTPVEPEHQPSEMEDIDAMLIDHEFRLTMIELGV